MHAQHPCGLGAALNANANFEELFSLEGMDMAMPELVLGTGARVLLKDMIEHVTTVDGGGEEEARLHDPLPETGVAASGELARRAPVQQTRCPAPEPPIYRERLPHQYLSNRGADQAQSLPTDPGLQLRHGRFSEEE